MSYERETLDTHKKYELRDIINIHSMDVYMNFRTYLIKSIGENVVNMTKNPWKKNHIQPCIREMTNAVIAIDYIGIEDEENEQVIFDCYAHMFLHSDGDDHLSSELVMKHMFDRFSES